VTHAASTTAVDRPPPLRVARRVLLIALLASVAVLLVLACLLLLDVSSSQRTAQAAGSAVVTGVWSLLGFAVLRSLDASSRLGARWFLLAAWIAASASTLAAAAWLILIWIPSWIPMSAAIEDALARGGWILSIWTVVAVIPLAFVSRHPLPAWARLVALLGGCFIGWLALLGTCGVLAQSWVESLVRSFGEETFFRLHAAGAIFAFCGLVVVAVVQRLLGRGEPERGRTIPWRLSMQATCPRCGLAQALAVDGGAEGSRCGRCRLRILVEIDEPRCACGYVLYKLSGDACPECGRPVPEEDRWMSHAVDSMAAGTVDRPSSA